VPGGSSTEADLTGHYGSRGQKSGLRDSKDLRNGMGDTGKGSPGGKNAVDYQRRDLPWHWGDGFLVS
jgi:hypothetical protein